MLVEESVELAHGANNFVSLLKNLFSSGHVSLKEMKNHACLRTTSQHEISGLAVRQELIQWFLAAQVVFGCADGRRQ
jgi:hypothetical protein